MDQSRSNCVANFGEFPINFCDLADSFQHNRSMFDDFYGNLSEDIAFLSISLLFIDLHAFRDPYLRPFSYRKMREELVII
jgi:hypothetical protein